jgi:hypothetical protein
MGPCRDRRLLLQGACRGGSGPLRGPPRKVAARRRGDPRHFDLLLCMFPPVSHIIQRDEVSADDAIISIGP